MADDELAPSVEEVEQGGLAVGALEDVLLLDLDHGELAALGDERVAAPGELLLLGEELLAVAQPFVLGCDLWKAHIGCDPAAARDSSVQRRAMRGSTVLDWCSIRTPRQDSRRGYGAFPWRSPNRSRSTGSRRSRAVRRRRGSMASLGSGFARRGRSSRTPSPAVRPSMGSRPGIGELASVRIAPADAERLQLNLLRSHAVGCRGAASGRGGAGDDAPPCCLSRPRPQRRSNGARGAAARLPRARRGAGGAQPRLGRLLRRPGPARPPRPRARRRGRGDLRREAAKRRRGAASGRPRATPPHRQGRTGHSSTAPTSWLPSDPSRQPTHAAY